MIRRLAWWGMNQSISSAVRPVASKAAFDHIRDHSNRVFEHLPALHAQMANGLGC